MSIGGCDDSAADEAGRYASASPRSNENFNKKNKIILFRIYIYECMSGTSMEKSQIRFQINEKREATIK